MNSVKHYRLVFNGEVLNAWCGVADARPAGGGLAPGVPVSVFFTGHAQRPLDARRFTGELARLSRSGLVIMPVMDTPCGTDARYHGDRGKVVMLMALIEAVLAERGLAVAGAPALPVEVLGVPGVQAGLVAVSLQVVGWSHGGLLARRFASAYPQSVVGLGQVCPAGYHHWPSWPKLVLDFVRESRRIAPMLLGPQAPDVLRANCGILRGLIGDAGRGLIAALRRGDLGPARRCIRDIEDCNELLDDANCPLERHQRVSVVFGLDDTVITAKLPGFRDCGQPQAAEIDAFGRRYYAGLAGGQLSLSFLRGNHLAPVTSCREYAAAVLAGLEKT